jgi:hypothetical protein
VGLAVGMGNMTIADTASIDRLRGSEDTDGSKVCRQQQQPFVSCLTEPPFPEPDAKELEAMRAPLRFPFS